MLLAEAPDGRPVALKVLNPFERDDPRSRERLAEEARATARVRSPFTAEFIDADTEGPVPWLASEYIAGPTLATLVADRGPLALPALLALAAALAEGLEHIHAAGLVHRNLTPSHVILAEDHPRIVGFGIAAPLESLLAGARGPVGTAGYMSPEQVTGEQIGPSSDIFSLGAVLTFAATGRTPFGGESPVATLYRILSDEPNLDGVPPKARLLITACLAKAPAERPSATALRERVYRVAARELGLDADGLREWMSVNPSGGRGPTPWWAGEGIISLLPRGTTPVNPHGPSEPSGAESAPGSLPAGLPAYEAYESGPPIRHGIADQATAEEPRPRFLTATAPERAPAGARISVLAQVTLSAAGGASAPLQALYVGPNGTDVTITVSAPGLVPLGDLEQDLFVPFAADSDPVRFGFRAGAVGLHTVQLRAFVGGTCLGDLTLEVSVEAGAALEEGRPRTVPLDNLAAEPGEVTLQVSRTAAGGYSFQLLSEALYPTVIVDRLAGDPSAVTNQMITELRALAKSTGQYGTSALVRRRLRSLGAQLWGDVVPQSVREQFWAQRDRISLFTIASDLDAVPWELLYPVDQDNDGGFLVEQFPVVRRVYGQGRARVLRLDQGMAFVVPPRSPANALDEVAAVREAFPAGVPNRGTEAGLAAVLDLLDSVPSVLHFAGHNTFADDTGSLINLDGGPLRPSDLSYARQRYAFESTRPLVFLNGCRTAGEISGFTQMIGWASEFMGAGAGAFVGSLWAVRSDAARTFAAEFYRALVHERQTLGAASLRARQAIAADEGDPTWLAYTVYGNPAAFVAGFPPFP